MDGSVGDREPYPNMCPISSIVVALLYDMTRMHYYYDKYPDHVSGFLLLPLISLRLPIFCSVNRESGT